MLQTKKFQELDIVELLEDLPEYDLKKGEIGVVVEVFDTPCEAYDLEFVDASGRSSRFAYSVRPNQIKASENRKRKANLHDVVEVAEDITEYGVKRGERGTVVEVLDDPSEAYILEFTDGSGTSSRLAYWVKPEQIVNFNAAAADATRQWLELFERGKLNEAEAQLRKAVEMNPSAQLLGELIRSFESAGRLEAIRTLRFLVRTAPDYEAGRKALAVAYMRYGVGLAQQNEIERAISFFDSALCVAPPIDVVSRILSDIAKAYTALGVRANEEGDYEKAVMFMRLACEAELSQESRSNLGLAYALLAEHQLRGRQYATAAESFELAIDAGFINAHLLNNYGIALLGRGYLDLARQEFEKALGMDPGNEPIRVNLINAVSSVPAEGLSEKPAELAEAKVSLTVLEMPHGFPPSRPWESSHDAAA